MLARDHLGLAVSSLVDHSNKLFYDQRYISWRDNEIKIAALTQLIRQIDSIAPPKGVSLPEWSRRLPERSQR